MILFIIIINACIAKLSLYKAQCLSAKFALIILFVKVKIYKLSYLGCHDENMK